MSDNRFGNNAFVLVEVLVAVIISSIIIGGILLGIRQAQISQNLINDRLDKLNSCISELYVDANKTGKNYIKIDKSPKITVSIDGKVLVNTNSEIFNIYKVNCDFGGNARLQTYRLGS